MMGSGGNNDDPRNLWVASSKWPLKTKNPAPVPVPKPQAQFARMKHPREHGVYYSSMKGEWVRHGWTVWSMELWKQSGFDVGFNYETNVDNQGRHWEFFGYRIPMIRAE